MAIFATANGLYTSENGVISLMNSARALTPDNVNNFLSDEEDSLLRLIDICETQENDFFDIFTVEGNTLIERVNNFQKRVDEYNRAVSGVESWLTNKVYAILAELQQYFEQASRSTLLEYVNTAHDQFVFDVNDLTPDQIEDGANYIIDNLNRELKNIDSGQFFIKKGYERTNATRTQQVVGLKNYMVGLKTYIDPDTGITKVQIDGFSSDIPRTMLLKLKAIIDKKNNVKVNNRRAFRNIVLDIAEKHAKNLSGNSKLDPYLAYEIRRARQNVNPIYDVNRSEASVKGFLGEIANNATLAYLFGRPGAVIPTGTVTNVKTGAQIPIDAIFQSFKFQVKNYGLHEGIVTFRNSNTAENLINSKAQVSGLLGEMLTSLFGAFHFNQPFDFKSLAAGGSDQIQEDAERLQEWYNNAIERTIPKYTSETYEQLYSVARAENISEIFAAQVDKIISLRSTFAGSQIFTKEQEYRNTFFKIGVKYVPSSLILRAMINTIRSYREQRNSLDRLVDFDLTGIDVKTKSNSLGEFILYSGRKRKLKNQPPPFNAHQAASLVRLSYEVRFDLNKLMDEAYNKILM